jgi:UDP-N-acetylenolpyruvoylglucosamine reductase
MVIVTQILLQSYKKSGAKQKNSFFFLLIQVKLAAKTAKSCQKPFRQMHSEKNSPTQFVPSPGTNLSGPLVRTSGLLIPASGLLIPASGLLIPASGLLIPASGSLKN